MKRKYKILLMPTEIPPKQIFYLSNAILQRMQINKTDVLSTFSSCMHSKCEIPMEKCNACIIKINTLLLQA